MINIKTTKFILENFQENDSFKNDEFMQNYFKEASLELNHLTPLKKEGSKIFKILKYLKNHEELKDPEFQSIITKAFNELYSSGYFQQENDSELKILSGNMIVLNKETSAIVSKAISGLKSFEFYKQTPQSKYDYELKFLVGDMIVFNALFSNNSFYIVPIKDLGIDETFENIFLRVLSGSFSINYIEKKDFETFDLNFKKMVINEGSYLANLTKFASICEDFLFIKTQITRIDNEL